MRCLFIDYIIIAYMDFSKLDYLCMSAGLLYHLWPSQNRSAVHELRAIISCIEDLTLVIISYELY